MSKKPVLIVEHCLDGLTKLNEEAKKDGKYILGGTFTEFNVKNRNDRIYTADKFLPHLEELNRRRETLGVVYGEFDHPDVFDTSLSRVSHLIESVTFNKERNIVEGTIRLLNTHWGKEAKALVDDGCPIFVSSRAAGVTESDGTVTVKKLFTYDAVADPGFGSARMEVISLNESLGFNESANFRIYDISDESKINELFEMNKDEMVTKTQMLEYSKYLTEEIEKFKTEINQKITTDNGKFEPSKLNDMFEYYEKMQETQTKIAKYLDYLAEKVQIVVNENVSLKKTTSELASHSDYLAENLEKSINYTEYLAENVDKTIDYSKYIAETLDKNIDFSEYIAEHVDKNIKYSEYLAESLDKTIDYSEYIAENLDKSIDYTEYIAENVDKSIEYSEYIAENVDKSIEYSEYIAENVDKSIEYSEYIAEHVDNNISYSEYIAENLDDSMAYTNYIAESLDKTVESTKKLTTELKKGGKLNESFNLITEEDYSITDTEQYYNTDDTGNVATTGIEIGGQSQVQAEPGSKVQVEAEPGSQIQVEAEPGSEITVEPELDDELPTEEPGVVPVEDEGEGEVGLTPGEIVAVGDSSGEVLASNPQSGLVVIQLDSQEEPIEIHESKVTRLGDKIYNSEKSLQDNISRLIYETKKRKASEQDEPNFLLFLSEKKKAAYYNLSQEDRAKVNIALKESEGKYTTESQVLAKINEALSPKTKTFNDMLIDAMPIDLTAIWEKLEPKVQQSVLNQAKLFPNLNTEQKFESFWNSRDLQRYTNEKPAKKVLNENKVVSDVKISDDELARMKAVFERLNG
ncbi:MAG: hypothetical protein K9J13_11290 [Saprospiraceae bacterium]|nr:hypothetical protein [Saprospiraceae bacterium]